VCVCVYFSASPKGLHAMEHLLKELQIIFPKLRD